MSNRGTNLPFIVLALASLLAAPLAAAGDEDIPRTASGRPDLSGNYDVANLTPFERNPRFGDKLHMTVEEAERIAMGDGGGPCRRGLKTITQTEDHVVIMVEWMHWAKVVRLNAEHPPAEYRSIGGDSIGWWEGDTLVVETTNFLDSQSDPRDGLKVIERFSRHGPKDLLYGFTVHDTDYEAPYSGELIWPGTDDLLYEFACHEGNYAMGNILRGARLLEKEYYEKKGQSSTGSGSGR